MKKAELERELTRCKAALKAATTNRFYRVGNVDCVAVPLTSAERAAVADYASGQASEHIGDPISDDVFDYAGEWHYRLEEPLLPRFAGLLIRYTYNREEGTYVIGIWGLLRF